MEWGYWIELMYWGGVVGVLNERDGWNESCVGILLGGVLVVIRIRG